MEITFVDRQGRVYLPKKLREEIGIKEGTVFRLERENKKIVLEQTKGIARGARGIFKLKTRIKDVDKLIEKYSYEEAAKLVKRSNSDRKLADLPSSLRKGTKLHSQLLRKT